MIFILLPHRQGRRTWAVFLGGVLVLYFWQGNLISLFSRMEVAASTAVAGRPFSSVVTAKTVPGEIPTFEIFVNNDSPAVQASTLSRGNSPGVSQADLDLLARVIYGEARGEDFVGQVAVGAVVLNRLDDPRFPKTIRDVIYQPGAFTAVTDKQIHLEPDQTAYRAAEAALIGEDPTGGALYYYNPRIATDKWIKSRPVVKKIGNHTFGV